MKNALVFDPDESIRNIFKFFLEGYGYNVLLAEDQNEAIQIIESFPIHIMITDYWLDTKILAEIIPMAKAWWNPTIIIMSTMPDSIEVGKEFQVDHVLKKPFDIEQLEAIFSEK